MKRIAVLCALLLACGAACATEIRDYRNRVEIGADGAGQVRARVELAGAQAGRLRLPVGFAAIEDFRTGTAPLGVTIVPRAANGQAWLEMQIADGAPAHFGVDFTFRAPGMLFVPKPEEGQKPAFPHGSRLLRHAFVNTQDAPIGRYQVQVLLPEDTVVHAVREQLPKPKRKEFLPRVELDRFDDRQGALLQLSSMRQGDRTSMELEVVEQQRSLAWLLVLLPLAVGYLVAFRDTVRPAAA